MADSNIDTRFRVEGMDCAACATKVEAATRRVTGVENVSVSVTAGTMTVRHSASTDLAQIAQEG
jgi:Cd2+/Zn2+-exporting ATPase